MKHRRTVKHPYETINNFIFHTKRLLFWRSTAFLYKENHERVEWFYESFSGVFRNKNTLRVLTFCMETSKSSFL